MIITLFQYVMIMKILLMTQYILRQVRLEISQHHSTLVLLEDTKLEKKKIGQTNHEGNLKIELCTSFLFLCSSS